MDKAIRAAVDKAGGWRPLARALGIKVQSVQRWKRIPAERVLQIEKTVGLRREFLRPDLYPKNDRR
jgi:DNA-binding transcriptional regulator YdaS (Cro superfamily)